MMYFDIYCENYKIISVPPEMSLKTQTCEKKVNIPVKKFQATFSRNIE